MRHSQVKLPFSSAILLHVSQSSKMNPCSLSIDRQIKASFCEPTSYFQSEGRLEEDLPGQCGNVAGARWSHEAPGQVIEGKEATKCWQSGLNSGWQQQLYNPTWFAVVTILIRNQCFFYPFVTLGLLSHIRCPMKAATVSLFVRARLSIVDIVSGLSGADVER